MYTERCRTVPGSSIESQRVLSTAHMQFRYLERKSFLIMFCQASLGICDTDLVPIQEGGHKTFVESSAKSDLTSKPENALQRKIKKNWD